MVVFSVALAPTPASAKGESCGISFSRFGGLLLVGGGLLAGGAGCSGTTATPSPTPTPTPDPERRLYRNESDVAAVEWCLFEGGESFEHSEYTMTGVARLAYGAQSKKVFCVPSRAKVSSKEAGAETFRKSVEKALASVENSASPRLVVEFDSHGVEGVLIQQFDSEGKEADLPYTEVVRAIAEPMRDFYKRTGKKPQLTLINNVCNAGSCLASVKMEFKFGDNTEFPVTVISATDADHAAYGNLLLNEIWKNSEDHRVASGAYGPPVLPELIHNEQKKNRPVIWSNHDESVVKAARATIASANENADLHDEIRNLSWAPQRNAKDVAEIERLIRSSKNDATVAAAYRFLREKADAEPARQNSNGKKPAEEARALEADGKNIAAAEAYGLAIIGEKSRLTRYQHFRHLMEMADKLVDKKEQEEVGNVLGALAYRITRETGDDKIPSGEKLGEEIRRLGGRHLNSGSKDFLNALARAIDTLPKK